MKKKHSFMLNLVDKYDMEVISELKGILKKLILMYRMMKKML